MVRFKDLSWSVIVSLKKELNVYTPAFYDHKTGNIYLLADEIFGVLNATWEKFPLQSHMIWASLFVHIINSSVVHEFCHGQGFNEQQAIAAAKTLVPSLEEVTFGDVKPIEGMFKEGVSWRLVFVT